MKEKSLTNRNIAFDLLRILACFMIIIDHTAGGFLVTNPYNRWWLLLDFYFFLSKPAVALFFMLSGSLLLKKQESVKNWLTKRVLRIVLVIIIFTLPHELFANGSSFDLLSYIKFSWSSSTGSYWYLYAYLGLMLTLPITRKLANALDKWEYIFGFILWGVFIVVLPQLVTDCGFLYVNPHFSIGLFSVSSYVLFLLGHFLTNVCTFNFDKRGKLLICLLGIAPIFVATFVTKNQFLSPDGSNFLSLDKYDSFSSVIPAICLFMLAVSSKSNQHTVEGNEKKTYKIVARIITEVSQVTFGIYLLSDIGIKQLMQIYFDIAEKGLEVVFSCIIYDLVVFLILGIIVYILRLIPPVKKLI